MKYGYISVVAAGLAVTCAYPVQATVINFDNLGNGVVVTNQYAGVTFSSTAGSQVLTTAQSIGSSLPNFICSGVGGRINCTDPIFIDFANAVSGLSFLAVGDDTLGINGTISVFGTTGLLGTVNTFGDNVFLTPYTVNLSAFSGITRIAITNTDPGGLGYDDFRFDQGDVRSAVPEPATWAMMLVGFGAMGYSMRRTRRRSRNSVLA